MQNIWFSSDFHLGHKNIVAGTSCWDNKSGCRDFISIEEHDETILGNINSLIKTNDILYFLGDFSFGSHENIPKYREMINCKNIHLILGNHDHHIAPSNSPYRSCFSSVNYINKFSFKVDSMKSGRYGKQKFFLSHYSHQVWENSHHGTIHLFGHSHNTLKGLGRSMDVGLDTYNYYPYHMDEILNIMKDIKPHEIDHHNELTT